MNLFVGSNMGIFIYIVSSGMFVDVDHVVTFWMMIVIG